MSYALQKLLNPHLHDLNPIFTGEAACPPGEAHTVAQKCTVIHYIRSGSGIFISGGEQYRPRPGQAFIMLPGEEVHYRADENDPWVYAWVGFTGALSEKFAALPPVFDVPEDMFLHLKTPYDWEQMGEYWGYQMATDLLLFYAKVLRPQVKKVDYVQEIAQDNKHFKELIDLTITRDEVASILKEAGFSGYRFDGALEWIFKSIQMVREL